MSAQASPVYALLKNPSMVDFPGRLALVLFVSGCNFSCGYCHNAILRRAQAGLLSWEHLERSCREYRKNWVDAAVITGGEPTLSEDLPELIRRLKALGMVVKLDTNGGRPDVLERLMGELEYVAMDVKCSLERYPELAGFSDAGAVHRSMELIRSRARGYEFRTTVITPFHTDEELLKIGELIRGARRYTIQPFVPREDVADEAYRTLPRTTPLRMKEAAAILRPFVEALDLRGA